ncbi:MAG: hypothetical protein MI867_24625, partial [Pseudomonadales bacterium]|nr:hypothetical protein [Pseudomonadales bacterium]
MTMINNFLKLLIIVITYSLTACFQFNDTSNLDNYKLVSEKLLYRSNKLMYSILTHHSSALYDYDEINAQARSLSIKLNQLYIDSQINGDIEIRNQLAAVIQEYQGFEKLIERYKTIKAQYRNAENYLPNALDIAFNRKNDSNT